MNGDERRSLALWAVRETLGTLSFCLCLDFLQNGDLPIPKAKQDLVVFLTRLWHATILEALLPAQLCQKFLSIVYEIDVNHCYALVTSCRRAAASVCPAPLLHPRGRRSAFRRRADGNVFWKYLFTIIHRSFPQPTRSHAHRCTVAAWRANTAVSKAAWWP